MPASDSSVTRISLLMRVRHEDPEQRSEAWVDFVERYGPMIFQWCRRRGLQMADAQDVTQDVLIRLARVMLTFEYDPAGGFRKWLKQVTRNAVADFFRDLRRKPDSPAWANDPQLLNEVSTDSDLSERLQEAFDLELFELAVDRVKERIDERRWRAWHLFAIDKWTVADISVELNMKVQSVYSSRYQVQALISEEVQKLEESESRSLLIRLPPSGST